MSWFEQSYEGLDREEEKTRVRKEQKAKLESGLRRLWLPPKKNLEATFVSDPPFCFWEHQLKIDGNWRNWCTCVRGLEGYAYCPICKLSDKIKKFWRYYAGAYKIIDHNEWTDRSDVTHKDTPLLMIARKDSLAVFRNHANIRSGLVGCKYNVFRAGEKSASIGDDWNFLDKTPIEDLIEKYGEELCTPPNFPEMLAPMSMEDLQALAEQVEPSMSELFAGGPQEDTAVAF